MYSIMSAVPCSTLLSLFPHVAASLGTWGNLFIGLLCTGGYIIIALFAWALCKAAAKGDEQLGIEE
jgi:hypothetical protein